MPLVFIYCALVPQIADSMQYISDHTGPQANEESAGAAIFYSISSTQPGLRGVDLGNFLIKRVVETLRSECPDLHTFSTLSPIPGFRKWLTARVRQGTDNETKFFTSLLSPEEGEVVLRLYHAKGGSTCADPHVALLEVLDSKVGAG